MGFELNVLSFISYTQEYCMKKLNKYGCRIRAEGIFYLILHTIILGFLCEAEEGRLFAAYRKRVLLCVTPK